MKTDYEYWHRYSCILFYLKYRPKCNGSKKSLTVSNLLLKNLGPTYS